MRVKTSPLFEIVRVLVRLDHVASIIALRRSSEARKNAHRAGERLAVLIHTSTAHRAVATKNTRVNFTPWQIRDARTVHIILSLPCGDEKRHNPAR
jgi:hypothetical protein